jgi:transitional endoplasmic reticulum ATPase
MHEVLREVWKRIELPHRHPARAQHLGAIVPQAILLHGPTGTGKTALARAIAKSLGAVRIELGGADVLESSRGASEEAMRQVFDRARTQAAKDPNRTVVLIINEIDVIAGKRVGVDDYDARLANQLLTLLERLPKNLLVIGTTNSIQRIDPAILRPDRFGVAIRVPAPDEAGRHQILQIQTQKLPLGAHVSLAELVRSTSGFTGADLQELVGRASIAALARLSEPAKLRRNEREIEALQERLTKLTSLPAEYIRNSYAEAGGEEGLPFRYKAYLR